MQAGLNFGFPYNSDQNSTAAHTVLAFMLFLTILAHLGAALLHGLGARAGDAVVVLHPMSLELYAALIAVFRLGMIAVVAGLVLSGLLDSPSGPSIVLMAAMLFVLTLAVPKTN